MSMEIVAIFGPKNVMQPGNFVKTRLVDILNHANCVLSIRNSENCLSRMLMENRTAKVKQDTG